MKQPVSYQFTFQQLAQNTKAVLDELNIDKIYLLGHSMGGMLATRFTLMYPERVEKLILENPIGLEDWKLVVPYLSIDENYQRELMVTYDTAKKYQLSFYYDNQWKPEMEEYRKIYAQVDEMELPLAGTKEEKDCFRLFSNGKQCRRRQKIIADCLEKIYTQTLMMLNSCEIDYNNPPARSKTVVSVNEVPLGTYDNLFCITGFPFLLYF